jgi:hypothetical protein
MGGIHFWAVQLLSELSVVLRRTCVKLNAASGDEKSPPPPQLKIDQLSQNVLTNTGEPWFPGLTLKTLLNWICIGINE